MNLKYIFLIFCCLIQVYGQSDISKYNSRLKEDEINKKSLQVTHWTRHIATISKSDFIYKASNKPLTEKFEILRRALIFAVILPSQEINCSDIDKYSEDISINLIKISDGEETIEAYGNFTEYSEFNGEITIPLTTTEGGYLTVHPTPGNNYYVIEIKFSKEGFYPWFLERKFSSSFIFTQSSDRPGLIMGFEYNLSSI